MVRGLEATLDTYWHLWPDSEDRTREAIDSVLGRPGREAATAPEESAPNVRQASPPAALRSVSAGQKGGAGGVGL
jgi:hypothetical protein